MQPEPAVRQTEEENIDVKSLNGRFHAEPLNQHLILSLLGAQFHIGHYRRTLCTARAHEDCAPLTPHDYATTFTAPSPTRLPV